MDTWTCFRIGLDAARERERALAREVAEQAERIRAMEIVLDALAHSVGWRGLNRRRFKALVARAGRETPDTGPEAARHAVFLAQARRVLGDGRSDPPAS